jgi:hypothetical protein
LELSLGTHEEELSKRKVITSGIRAMITTISTSYMISEVDAVILYKLTGLLKTKQKELEVHNRKP